MTNTISTIMVSHDVPSDAHREIERLFNEEVGFCNDGLMNYVPGGITQYPKQNTQSNSDNPGDDEFVTRGELRQVFAEIRSEMTQGFDEIKKMLAGNP